MPKNSKTVEKEQRWGQTFDGIPPGLRVGKAIKAAREEETNVAANIKSAANAVAVHNVLAAEARKTAGIKAHGCNRGLSDTGKDRTKGK